MKVISFPYCGFIELYANTYVVIDENDDCFVVDPGRDYSGIKDFIKDNNLHLKGILLTHGHFDHTRGTDILVDAFNAPVFISKEDAPLLTKPHLNCSDRFSRKDVVIKAKPILIKDGDCIAGLTEPIIVVATPYHTEGSVCFYLKDSKIVFTGDSLFKGSVGRTDFITSHPELMDYSLSKIMALDGDAKVYPGHEGETTINYERNTNPFVKR